MDFRNAKELLELCRQTDLSISEIMRQREIEQGETTGEEADCRMAKAYEIMQQSCQNTGKYTGSVYGSLIGGEAKRLSEHQKSGKSMCGSLLGKAMMYAMAVLETNSSMGLIVAAPTAGSAGIVPGLMIAMQEEYGFTDEQMIRALYNAGAIGYPCHEKRYCSRRCGWLVRLRWELHQPWQHRAGSRAAGSVS